MTVDGRPGHSIPTGNRQNPLRDAVEPALNAFAITFGDRFPATETYEPKPPETPFVRLCRAFGGDGA